MARRSRFANHRASHMVGFCQRVPWRGCLHPLRRSLARKGAFPCCEVAVSSHVDLALAAQCMQQLFLGSAANPLRLISR